MWVDVIRVSGEGGGLTLKGMKLKDGTWLFTRIKDETTLAEFLSGDDLKTLYPFLKSQSKVVVGFKNGICLLNAYWPNLYARFVHPDFRESVWDIVLESDIRNSSLRVWAEVCFPEPEEASIRYTAARRNK